MVQLVLSILANPFGIHNNYKNDILVIYSPYMLQLHYYLLGLCNNNDDVIITIRKLISYYHIDHISYQ